MTTTRNTPTAPFAVYRWNGERAFHIFPYGPEMPTAAVCGLAFPDTAYSREFWHHWMRQNGDLAEMQQWIVDTPMLHGHICEGCQNA